MKHIFTLIFLFVCVIVKAASPSFSSFNTSQFNTAGNQVSVKTSGVFTNMTNVGDFYIRSNTSTFNGNIHVERQSQYLIESHDLSHNDAADYYDFNHSNEAEWIRFADGGMAWGIGYNLQGKSRFQMGGSGHYHGTFIFQYDNPNSVFGNAATNLLGSGIPVVFGFNTWSNAQVSHYGGLWANSIDTNGNWKLNFFYRWNPQGLGFNQVQHDDGVHYSPGGFSTNLFWDSANFTNTVVLGTNTYTTNITIGDPVNNQLMIGSRAANTLSIFYANNLMLELGANNGGSGNLRNASGTTTLDWVNKKLLNGSWTLESGNLLFTTGNSDDIGASTSPARSGYFGTSLNAAAAVFSNTVTSYNGSATAGNGLMSVVGTFSAANQSASIAATAFYTNNTGSDGVFKFYGVAQITTAGPVTGSLTFNVTSTNAIGAVTYVMLDGSTPNATSTAEYCLPDAFNLSVGGFEVHDTIYMTNGAIAKYSTTYAGGTGNAMRYRIDGGIGRLQ